MCEVTHALCDIGRNVMGSIGCDRQTWAAYPTGLATRTSPRLPVLEWDSQRRVVAGPVGKYFSGQRGIGDPLSAKRCRAVHVADVQQTYDSSGQVGKYKEPKSRKHRTV